ncbi:MAG: PadR family transcriptional regulator [Anaerolineaceae bacterium]
MDNQDPNTKKFQKELISGIASLVLLSVLDHSEKPLYGYQITKNLERENKEIPLMKLGALYPVLRSLEKSALLISQVEPSVSGPPRRYYSITSAGKSALKDWQAIWQQTSEFTNSILEGNLDNEHNS